MMTLREPLTRAEQLLLDLCRAIAYEELDREDIIIRPDPKCGICTSGVGHERLCPRHAAQAYCGGLE